MTRKNTIGLIHGWGTGSWVWQMLRQQPLPGEVCFCPDLFAPQQEYADQLFTPVRFIETLAGTITEPIVLVGWSLGGIVAMQLAKHCKAQIRALILLHSIPKFVMDDNWPYGVKRSEWIQLAHAMQHAPDRTRYHFYHLITKGGKGQHDSIRYLGQQPLPDAAQIKKQLQWLHWLAEMDFRRDFSSLTIPTHILLGEQDPLICATIEKELYTLNSQIKITIVPDCGHSSPLSHPHVVAHTICTTSK